MPQIFPEHFLQEVMDKSDIVDTVSRYVQLKRSGNSMKGLCPFHKEKTPSFTVSADKQLYYCFGCGNGGTIINFVMQMENLEFVDAVKLLAEQAGMSVPEPDGRHNSASAQLKKLIYEINRESARFFYDCLLSEQGERARDYLFSRGLTQNTINKFGLGYAPDGGRLLKHLTAKGYDEEQLVQSGMALKNDSGAVYDRFRNRIIFPIIDVRKNIIGFGGRVMDDGMPKYLNSPETAAFSKSYNLYGLNFAKSTKDDYYILAEGYMDVISLHQNGITSAVATLGTALTPEQARIIKRSKHDVVIAYDGDEAGQNATKRAIELLADEDITVKVLSLKDCKDPDEYIKKKGVGAFRELVKDADLQIEYKIGKLKEKYDLSVIEEKVKYVNELAAEFSKIKSPVEREIYINKISQETGVSAASIFSEVERLNAVRERKRKFDGFRGTPSVGRLNSANPKKANVLRAEKLLLNLMCLDGKVSQMAEELQSDDFEEGVNRELFDFLLSIRADGAEPDARLVVSQVSDSAAAAEILHDDQNIDDKPLAAQELIKLLKNERNKRRLFEMVTDSDVSQSQKLYEMKKCLGKEVGSGEQH